MLTRRLQVLLDDKRYQRLEAAARRRRVSVATVVREAIDRDLGSPALDRSAAGRRVLAAPTMEVGSVEDLLAEIDKQRGLLIIKPDTSTVGFTKGYRANRVIGTFGFTLYHRDLVHAVCVYASQLHRAKSSQGKKSSTVRQATTSFLPNTIPPEVKEILYPYRNSVVII